MVQVRRSLPGLVPQLVLALGVLLADAAQARKFYLDDPMRAVPRPIPVPGQLPIWEATPLYDFLVRSVRQKPRPETPARSVNTLGEVPDSAWFTNRHGARRMTREQLQRGPGAERPPLAPFIVVKAKTKGITPGFEMTDARGSYYFVKPDPITNPEMATAAEVIGSRFFYAIGYNTPENYLVELRRSDLKVSPKAQIEGLGGKKRAMLERDLDDILLSCARHKDGTYQMIASLRIPGYIGEFRYEGTRSDDPNDTVPHEHRRDLRGLRVFCAWLNHTDAKGGNSADALVQEDGVRFVRHFLMDFGSMLGSDSDMAKNPRFGNEYVIPKGRQVLARMFLFGLDVRRWESADYGGMKAVGRLESRVFDPEKWKPNYPNPAFLNRLPDDEYWAAKIVMAFREEDIRAIIETGQYSDPRVVDYITARLVERRNKIGRVYLTKVLALDNFRIEDGELKSDDLAVRLDCVGPRQYQVAWARFDNETERSTPIDQATTFRVPEEAVTGGEDTYYAATIRVEGERAKAVTVYVHAGPAALRVVGVERTWR